ncbi:aldehyde ferredoxin oxidoreductase N-terminal domain-containing protein [Coprothermobacter platensis]|uniref:aldehyde ferredoxin oxidoreductase N-terminal domain-containing protein n=1 Tax=Coprothermobacter platensis TaxID=108819 RepID=UPI00036E9A0F|nr:aldehyde ferredoxin oxidoreductase N-terminal domain-containing protein [Coprothermobacter platensis]
MLGKDYIRVLHINLTDEKVSVEERKDLFHLLGGTGVASKLLEENMRPDLPPLHEDQPIIFAIGPLSTIFPVATKTVATFISPLTGEYGESHAGGRSAMAIRNAGYDAIVITGRANKPTYLSITDHSVEFKDARGLWGLDVEETGRIIREREGIPGKRSIMRIGVSGENLVSFAGVNVDTYRHFGRLGLGAVFGSKQLKAIAITGETDIPVTDFKSYYSTFRWLYKKVVETDLMSKYHEIGTPINIKVLNAISSLPTKNLQQSTFEHADDISGETFAQDTLVRKVSCVGCPIGCIHVGQFRRLFDKGYEYESLAVSYDHELIYSLGSLLGTPTASEVLELIDEVEETGLDAMSTGVALAWATEALEKDILSIEQTLVPLAFGNTENYKKAIHYIAERTNDFYRTLGEGLTHATEAYGGKEFALVYGGNEMAGYHTGYAFALGQTVGGRHSHLCNAGYQYDQSAKELNDEEIVDYLIKEEKERCMLTSLVICLFARKVYDRETVLKALNAIDMPFTDEDLDKMAEETFFTRLRIKQKLGYSLENEKFPKRAFETPTRWGKMDEERMNKLLHMYVERLKAEYDRYSTAQ